MDRTWNQTTARRRQGTRPYPSGSEGWELRHRDQPKAEATWENYFDAILSGVSHLHSSISSLTNQYYTNQQAEMELRHQADLAALDLKLENELITQEQYDKRRKALDKKQLDEKITLRLEN